MAHDVQVPVNVSAGEENYASRHANGTGPFILEGVRAQWSGWSWCATRTGGGLERYPHNIDRIEYTPIADPEERLATLLPRRPRPADRSAVRRARP